MILIKIWMILGPQESSRFGKCLSQTEFHRCCISGNFRNSQIFSSFMSPDETSLFLRSKFTIVTMHPLGIGHESLHYCIRLDFIFCFKLSRKTLRKSLSGIDSNDVSDRLADYININSIVGLHSFFQSSIECSM